MTNFFLIIYLFRNSVEDTMELNLPLEKQEALNNSLRKSSSSESKNANLDNNEPSDIESEISEIKSNDSVIDTTSELENISNNSEPQITLVSLKIKLPVANTLIYLRIKNQRKDKLNHYNCRDISNLMAFLIYPLYLCLKYAMINLFLFYTTKINISITIYLECRNLI